MAKKTAKLPGQIISRGPGRWLLRWFLGRDGQGKRHYDSKMFEGTFHQATKALEKERAASLNRGNTVPNRQTVAEFYPDWLASKKDIEENTRSQYEHRYAKDIEPFFGNILLKDVTPQLVQRWIEWLLTERGLSARSIQYSVTTLGQILRLAFRWSLVPSVATDGAGLPKKEHSEQAVLTPKQITALLDKASEEADTLLPLWSLLLTGGLRPQEALALEVSDLQGNRVSISKAVKWLKGKASVGATKTAKSRRTIMLPEATADLLRTYLKQTRTIAGPIFRNSAGGLLDISKVRKAWVRACKKAEVPVVRLYDARHSHLTALLAAGVPLKVASERAGHSSVKITGDTYSHVLPEMDDRAAKVMEELLAPKSPPAAASGS
jgi:integrase